MEATYTYTPGYRFKFEGDITTKTMVELIDSLEAQFGEGFRFVPEAITEGGLELVAWPGAHIDGAYKAMRFRVSSGAGEWPWITNATLSQWRTQGASVIWEPLGGKRTVEGTLFYKAFTGAPCWTRAELEKVKAAFALAGVKCTGAIPSAKSLRSVGKLGEPAKKRARDDEKEEEVEKQPNKKSRKDA
jgi:hypothetical protein